MWLIVILALAVVLIFGARGSSRRRQSIDLPYQKRRYFFTRAEQRFFERLGKSVHLVGREYTIFAKVRMSDLLIMTKGTTGRSYWAALSRINQKHADFVIVRPTADSEGLEPILVIELDDASHELEDRQQRDTLIDAIYARAGLPILHIPARPNYDVDLLARQIRSALGLPEPESTSRIGLPTRSAPVVATQTEGG